MNCANHPDAPRVAFCRTCGKALCANCAHNVQGVIYCEDCLANRMHGGVAPAANVAPAVADPAFQPGNQPFVPVAPVYSGPNPALAGILGAIPFGIGAVYNGQYAKALAHLGIFVALIWGLNEAPGRWAPVLGISMAFFVVYQIIDAVRSAHAIRMGEPPFDPFGLGQTFTTGEKVDTSKIPIGAVVLIILGGLFLLQTLDVPYFDMGKISPLFLIGLGVWLYAKRQGMIGSSRREYIRPLGSRGLTGPVVLVTVGVLFLINNYDGPGFGRTWPVLLLAIGLAKVLESRTPPAAGGPPFAANAVPSPPATPDTAGAAPQNTEPPSNEVQHG